MPLPPVTQASGIHIHVIIAFTILSLLLRWPTNLFHIGCMVPVVDLLSCCLLWCKHNLLTYPLSQSIPKGVDVMGGKVTGVGDTAR